MQQLLITVTCMIVALRVVNSYHHGHRSSAPTANQIEEWPSHEFSAEYIASWPTDVEDDSSVREKQQYQWLDSDLVQKNRREPGKLTLPGGCEMTHLQYQKLQKFRRDVDYVQNCYCQDGSVYCKLKKGGDHVHIT